MVQYCFCTVECVLVHFDYFNAERTSSQNEMTQGSDCPWKLSDYNKERKKKKGQLFFKETFEKCL